MNGRIIRTLVLKDLTLFFKNRFFAFVSILGVVAYVGMYFALPDTVTETVEVGLVGQNVPQSLIAELEDGGIIVVPQPSADAMRQAMQDGDFNVGLLLADDFAARLLAGQQGEMTVIFTADFPADLKEAYVILLQELGAAMSGQEIHVTATEEILGPDMAGRQIPDRDRMLPLFAVFVLLIETLGLASLITSEVEGGTLQALLITPTRIPGLFISKGIAGVVLAFLQASVLLLITGGLAHEPLLMLLALLLGSLMVTGLAFLLASVSRDLLSVMGWGILAILLLVIPALNVLLPGTASGWAQVIPSYYLVDTVNGVTNFDLGWADVAGNLLALLLFAVAFLALGIFALQRRQQRAFART